MEFLPTHPRPVIVITDLAPGGDDERALWMLLHAPEVMVVGIFSTSGNLWEEEVAGHLAALKRSWGFPAPLWRGPPAFRQERRLLAGERPRFAGAWGRRLPDEAGPGADVDAFRRLVAAHPSGVTVVLLAPATLLTDVCLAGVEVLFMGGSVDHPGNATACAEFNVWFDPQGAEALFASGAPVTLVPLDATACVPGRRMWDEVAVAVLLEPGLVSEEEWVGLGVETREGRVVRVEAGRRAVRVVKRVDGEGVARAVARRLAPRFAMRDEEN